MHDFLVKQKSAQFTGLGERNSNTDMTKIEIKGTMGEKEFIEDALDFQKHVTGLYNTFAGECKCNEMRKDFLNILNDEHQIQADIFNEMSVRGWYSTTNAEQQKIDCVKQKFTTES